MGRAAVICSLAIVMGALFVTSYTLALGDPVPHRIDAGLVGDPAGQAGTVDAVQRVARGSLVFHNYARSRPRGDYGSRAGRSEGREPRPVR